MLYKEFKIKPIFEKKEMELENIDKIDINNNNSNNINTNNNNNNGNNKVETEYHILLYVSDGESVLFTDEIVHPHLKIGKQSLAQKVLKQRYGMTY